MAFSGKNKIRVRYSYVDNKKIERVQRTIDLLAYGSLFLDICIALVTFLSLMNFSSGEVIMVPIHYILTAVVGMSLISGAMLLYLKHNERMMARLYQMKYKIKIPMPSARKRYSWRWTLRQKFYRARESIKRSLNIG
jgi:hypothetical protein